jgi:hypothetical protein
MNFKFLNTIVDENYNNIKERKSRTMMLPFQTLLIDIHQIVKMWKNKSKGPISKLNCDTSNLKEKGLITKILIQLGIVYNKLTLEMGSEFGKVKEV